MSQNKIKPQSPKENEVITYGAPVFAPDYSGTLLAADMCNNFNEHSMYIRFLCCTANLTQLLYCCC
jgi:hypothetical protein